MMMDRPSTTANAQYSVFQLGCSMAAADLLDSLLADNAVTAE